MINLMVIVQNMSTHTLESKKLTKNNRWFDVMRMETTIHKVGRAIGWLSV